MAFSAIIAVLPTVLPLVIDAIQTVERLFRRGDGPKRGEEKREVAVNEILEGLAKMATQARGANIPNFEDYKWIDLLLAGPEAQEQVAKVVDSLVELMNFLGKFEAAE